MVDPALHDGEPDARTEWSMIGIGDDLSGQLTALGFPAPTALQRALIPAVLDEGDVLMEAPPGTGRTAAVGIVIAELVSDCEPGDSALALVVTSTDARCAELSDAIQRCGAHLRRSGDAGIRCAVISELGPTSFQTNRLQVPLDVVIGTPDRLHELATAEKLNLSTLEMVVVDQADDLTVGDQTEDFTALIDSVPADRQRVVLASAVLSPLEDLMDGRLAQARRPELPTHAVHRTAVPQRAIAIANAGPQPVAQIVRSLGADPAVVVVEPDSIDTYTAFMAQTELPITVRTWNELGDIPRGATIVGASLPTWTDVYGRLLDAAENAAAAEIVLLSPPSQRQLLRALGKAGGTRLNASPMPTGPRVSALQMEHTVELIAAQLTRVSSQPTPRFLASVQRLAAEYDVGDIAAAAMDVAHEALRREIEPGADVPVLLRRPVDGRPSASDRRQTGAPPEPAGNRRKGSDRRGKDAEEGMTRLFVAAGYNYGVRPGDIVGAFAGESGLSGKEIGNIDIRESFTLVEVPERLADEVIDAMQTGTIKGRQIEVRRERY